MLGKIQTTYFEVINDNVKKANLIAEKSSLVITAEFQAQKKSPVTCWYSETAISAESP